MDNNLSLEERIRKEAEEYAKKCIPRYSVKHHIRQAYIAGAGRTSGIEREKQLEEALREVDEFTQVEYWSNSDTMKEIHRVIQEALTQTKTTE